MTLAPDQIAETAVREWRPYPEYKESGVEWLEDIPRHWEVQSLKTVASFISRGSGPDYVEKSDIAVINQACIYWDGVRLENVKFQRQQDVSDWKSFLRQGDLLINSTGAGTLGRAVVFDLQGVFIADSHITIVRVKPEKYDVQYLSYLIGTPAYQGFIYSTLTSGSTNQIELSREGLRGLQFIKPSLAEQRAIASFLDRETEKIDSLIARRRRLIELLEEKKTALISRAVTKGLDPDVPMKDSEIEWLGQIPAHWEAVRLKHVAKLESGHTPSRSVPEYWENGDISWVSLNDVGHLHKQNYITDTKNLINELGLTNSAAKLLPPETVILSRDATIGRCALLGKEMATAQHFVNWICTEDLLPEYLLFTFRVPMQQEFESLTMGATIKTIGMPDVNSFKIPLPSISEQRQIVEHVKETRSRIEELAEKLQWHVEKLREYRTALISAAVTGKIDVSEEVSSLEAAEDKIGAGEGIGHEDGLA